VSDPLESAFAARLDAAPDAPESMRARVFADVASARRPPAWTGSVLRYAAAIAIVIGGGTIAFSFIRPLQAPPEIIQVTEAARAPAATLAYQTSVVLGVHSIEQATRTMRSWPQTTVTEIGPAQRRLELPAARYRETLARLVRLGRLEHLTERAVNLRTALDEDRSRSAQVEVARIDVRLQPISGS
jgi:hypothetical protein